MSMIDYIRDHARYYNCPVCGRNLRGCQLRMVAQRKDRFTVQVTCAACRVSFVVELAIPTAALEGLEQEQEPVTEAAGAPEGSPARAPIQADEVLDVHLLLRDFRGSLEDLLEVAGRG